MEKKNFVNIVKLCVGARTIRDLADWQKSRISKTGYAHHITRMWPKRQKELLSGGSIYWVFKGLILARQKILDLEETITTDKVRRCVIILSNEIYKTAPQPKRAFQGWRYLSQDESPPDIGEYTHRDVELPHNLQAELSRFGVY